MGGGMMAGDLARCLDAALWFRDAGITPDPWQEVAIRSQSRRQLWNVHRQGGKSTTAALKALAKATSSPGSLTLLVSPAQRQSAELLRRVTELHGKIAGLPKPVFESMHRLEFDPAVGGRILSLPSSEATVRGYSRVGLAVLDECARIPDGIIGAIKPMQATAKDAELIALSTPNGEAGFFHEQWTRGGDLWERTKVTAEQCGRIDPAFLAEERELLGEMLYRQEYLCEFVANDEQVFGNEIIARALSHPDVVPLWP
jgi:terminase large subunit-like protein